jgi:hypothetical protein
MLRLLSKIRITSPHKGRDDRSALGARLDRGIRQDKRIRLDKDENLDFVPPDELADPALSDIAAQTALVEEMEREYHTFPEEVQEEIVSDLTVARSALNGGQKVPAVTLAHLVQVKNDQEMQNLFKTLTCSTKLASCGVSGGGDVSLTARPWHGLDRGPVGKFRVVESPIAGLAA